MLFRLGVCSELIEFSHEKCEHKCVHEFHKNDFLENMISSLILFGNKMSRISVSRSLIILSQNVVNLTLVSTIDSCRITSKQKTLDFSILAKNASLQFRPFFSMCSNIYFTLYNTQARILTQPDKTARKQTLAQVPQT